jgi:hypothetical protein
VGFPFILEGLFDLEGLGAGARLLQTIETKHTKKFYTFLSFEKNSSFHHFMERRDFIGIN